MSAHKKYMLNDEFPKAIKNATSTSDGLMSSEDKARLDSVFEFGLLSPATPDKDGLMSKEDKTKLDGIEEGANNYIHPDTPEIRHISDIEKNKWDTQVKYTNPTPLPKEFGGLEKGMTFDNMDYTDLITQLLYPYVDMTISGISMTPGSTIIEKGSGFMLTKIKFNVSTPSLPSTESLDYDFKMNNVSFNKLVTEDRSIDISINTSITDSTNITVTLTDSVNNKTKTFTLINYKFIYPFYYGVINNDQHIDQVLVLSKTKLLQDKGTKNLKFTTSNQKMIFAYPKDHGLLKSIFDANNFNVIGTFKHQELSITGRDGKPILYYIYTNDTSSVTDYNMQFVF